jgi:hypothetical protein
MINGARRGRRRTFPRKRPAQRGRPRCLPPQSGGVHGSILERRHSGDPSYHAHSIQVLEIQGDFISTLTAFMKPLDWHCSLNLGSRSRLQMRRAAHGAGATG